MVLWFCWSCGSFKIYREGYCISGLGHVTSEKQSPSALDYLGSMKGAVELERRATKPGTSKALKDVLGRCIAEYNRMVSNRRHKIDTDKKKLITNLFHVVVCWYDFVLQLCGWMCMLLSHNGISAYPIKQPPKAPSWWRCANGDPHALSGQSCILIMVSKQFNLYQEELSPSYISQWFQCRPTLVAPAAGLPLSLLQAEWWVPGSSCRAESSKFAGKQQYKEVLTTTQETCMTWIKRATQEHLLPKPWHTLYILLYLLFVVFLPIKLS